MRHSVFLKFIAIFLCAAALMTAVGSGAGLLVVYEAGLRTRTPEEVYADSAEGIVTSLAEELAVRCASRELGGAAEALMDQYYDSHWLYSTFDWSQLGYTIRDGAGTVLEHREYAAQADPAGSHSIQTSGSRYLNVLSTMTLEEYHAQINPPSEATEPPTQAPDTGLTSYNAVPEEGCEFNWLYVDYPDGSSREFNGSGVPLGHLEYFNEAQLIVRLTHPEEDLTILDSLRDNLPVGMIFADLDGRVVLELRHPERVVEEFSYGAGTPYIILLPLQEEGTSPESGVYDVIPEEGVTVSTLSIAYDDHHSESVGGTPDIGFLRRTEDGTVEFTSEDGGILDIRTEIITFISFKDENGILVYSATSDAGVGTLRMDGNKLVFTDREPAVSEPSEPAPGEGIYIYDDVPPHGYAVYKMKLWLQGVDAPVIIANDENLGLVTHDDAGNVFFTARNWKDFVFSKPAQIVYIQMCDLDGRLLYEAYQTGVQPGAGSVVGLFAYGADGELRYTCGDAAAAVAAYAEISPDDGEEPVTTPEETTEDSVPQETTEESIPQDTTEELTDATEPRTIPEEEPSAATEETYPAETEVTLLDEDIEIARTEDVRTYAYYDPDVGDDMMALYTYEKTPGFTVDIVLGPGALRYGVEWQLIELVYLLRDYLIPILAVSLLLLAVTAVYLCCAAGRRPGETEVRPGGLNRMPLDLYLCAAAGGALLCYVGIVEGGFFLLNNDMLTGSTFIVLMAFAACLLVVGFGFAFAAQVKTPGLFWWKHSLCGYGIRLIIWLWHKLLKFTAWLLQVCEKKLMPMLVRLIKAAWKLTKFFWLKLKALCVLLCTLLLRGCDWLVKQLSRFLSLLPLTWQFLLVGFTLVLLLYIMMRTYKVGYILVGFGIFFGVILYAASAFGILLENAKRMRKGDLDSKVDDKLLVGAFRDFAEELNGLADVAVVAAQKQLKSERMKTELITNVSHDIKTPLTSIINYVDLMEKPHTPEEQQAYLEVLSRQSQRLKKLVDDLMEMSKASTGNMAVEITKVNATEAVNQALGEFSDKLDRAQLIPVFRQPDSDIYMMADGRLVWRVLSNVLSNAVKYALPGTRLYIDLMEVDGKVVLSLKNISRESLNVSADELLERFVRGDTARNTEGSGLGLNIAKSLMELQKGQLELLVDGDLFKVTLIFPIA